MGGWETGRLGGHSLSAGVGVYWGMCRVGSGGRGWKWACQDTDTIAHGDAMWELDVEIKCWISRLRQCLCTGK